MPTRTIPQILDALPDALRSRIIVISHEEDTPIVDTEDHIPREDYELFTAYIELAKVPLTAHRLSYLSADDLADHISDEEYTMIEEYEDNMTLYLFNENGTILAMLRAEQLEQKAGPAA